MANSTRNALVVAALIGWSAQPAIAQVPTAGCPAGYWQMQALCFNSSTGDVVVALASPESRVEHYAGCRAGYWRLDALCHHPMTGDVELVDEHAWPAGQRTAAGPSR